MVVQMVARAVSSQTHTTDCLRQEVGQIS